MLLGLLVAGVALRVLAAVSWWPVTTTLDDGYELFASSPFDNQLHPGGYSLILAAIGLVTHEVVVPVFLQHLSGIASALLLWAATRRVSGSEWAGLVPAAIVLLDPDFIFLEHSIMSESWLVLWISFGLYATVRAFDQPEPWWRWPLLAGVGLALAVTIRTAPLFMIPVAGIALLLWRPRSFERWGSYWRAALALVAASALVLLAFATANATFGERFGLGASPGWYLYARAAQFADCSRFTPPAGTEALCEDRPPGERPGPRYYITNPSAPGPRNFGPFGEHDDLLGKWARRAILAQPGDYLDNVWQYLRGYWVPGSRPRPARLRRGARSAAVLHQRLQRLRGLRPEPGTHHRAGLRAQPGDLLQRLHRAPAPTGARVFARLATRGAVRRDGTVDRHDSHLLGLAVGISAARASGCCCSASAAWC